ncbi:hypothetical protein UVI_02060650 [Ustilaginoidea virens]|uniref:Uncharacterized protein n=1 Tax=Ustilaginoidea virens TaxID=1159556 RepID=A0A1B5L5Z0_USTVR|nr:hypothetical protein UVI_02060650 [Ustilaginoidea virens]
MRQSTSTAGLLQSPNANDTQVATQPAPRIAPGNVKDDQGVNGDAPVGSPLGKATFCNVSQPGARRDARDTRDGEDEPKVRPPSSLLLLSCALRPTWLFCFISLFIIALYVWCTATNSGFAFLDSMSITPLKCSR